MLYLLDTNAVIDLLNGNKNITAKIEESINDCEIKIPDIAYYEKKSASDF